MKILAIHYGHNATAGVLIDGRVVFAQSEERLNRLKNSTGWPEMTLAYIYEKYGKDFDYVVFPQETAGGYIFLEKQGFRSERFTDLFNKSRPRDFGFWLKYFVIKFFSNFSINYLKKKSARYQQHVENSPALKEKAIKYYVEKTGMPAEKIITLDHHKAHAYSPLFNVDSDKKNLVFTLDGEGDQACATVSEYSGGELKELSRVNKDNSLGYLYAEVTGLMGMRPNEDEFKVMGLAPYAKDEAKPVGEVYQLFREIISLDTDDKFEFVIPSGALRYYLWDKLMYYRFDYIAAGLQKFLEDIVLEWISRWSKKTGIKDVALSGGVFMNVKMNQRISEVVNDILVMPSSGDESLIFGCLFYGYRRYCLENDEEFFPRAFGDLYLGMADEEGVEEFFAHYSMRSDFLVEKIENINERVAELLANNEVVARMAGRMEWGARALGNRSILTNPASQENVRVINEMIKNRDFWMPFAPSMLLEKVDKYLVNPKKIFSPYMGITFDATKEGREKIIGALHRNDFTARVQMVSRVHNSGYHDLIERFEQKTGIGTVLNTSFNLHGSPVVATIKDGMEVMEKSSLKYLAIENYLVIKK